MVQRQKKIYHTYADIQHSQRFLVGAMDIVSNVLQYSNTYYCTVMYYSYSNTVQYSNMY